MYKYDSRINTFPEEVFLHEFLHSLERNAQEYGYTIPALHDNEKYGYKDSLYKHVSYDLWEMNEGIHLYSLASICAAFNSMTNIYDVIYESYKNNNFII